MDEVTKELKTRNRIMAIYNKTRDEFSSKEAWDDYLETIEDIIYNLSNNVDVQQTEARVSDYERTNRASILANQARKAEAQRLAWEAANPTVMPATAAAAANDAPQAYVPSSMGVGALPRAPVPVQQQAGTRKRYAIGSPDEQRQSAAAGWTPDMPRVRGLHEAFASLLINVGS